MSHHILQKLACAVQNGLACLYRDVCSRGGRKKAPQNF